MLERAAPAARERANPEQFQRDIAAAAAQRAQQITEEEILARCTGCTNRTRCAPCTAALAARRAQQSVAAKAKAAAAAAAAEKARLQRPKKRKDPLRTAGAPQRRVRQGCKVPWPAGQILATWTAADRPDDFWLCRAADPAAATSWLDRGIVAAEAGSRIPITWLERAGGAAGPRPLRVEQPRRYELGAPDLIRPSAVLCAVRRSGAPGGRWSSDGAMKPVELSRGEQQAVQLTRAERQTIFDALYPAGAPPPPLENLRAGHLPWRPAQRDMALLRFAAAEVRRGPGGRGPYTAILNSRRVPHLCGFSMYTRMG